MTTIVDGETLKDLSGDLLLFEMFEKGEAYQCDVAFVEEAAGFSARVLNLPEVERRGKSIEEATNNIRVALVEKLTEYIMLGTIPWTAAPMAIAAEMFRRKLLVKLGRREASNEDFLAYAAEHPIPQSWYDEEPQSPPQD